jgi:hypothetical protein
MAVGDPIPPDRVIYRALNKKRMNEALTAPNEIAFLLKTANGNYPDETHLSFGVSPAAAVAGLTNMRYICSIAVQDILRLDRHLLVTEDDDPQKVRVSGMPLITENEELSMAIAKDLLGIARMCP